MQASQSSLKLLGGCARRYYYEKVLDLGKEESGSLAVLGNVWHYSVEVFEHFGHDLNLAKQTFTKYWRDPTQLGLRIDFWHQRTTWESLHKRGLDMLERYAELAPWQSGQLIGTEIEFVVPIGDHQLHGFIDKLWSRPGRRLEVIDFKTGSYIPDRLRYNIQFTTYCYATECPEFWPSIPGFADGYERFKGWRRSGWWYHARNSKMISAGIREDRDYKRLSLAMDQLDAAHQANVWPLDISGDSCGWCPFEEEVCGSEMPNPLERTEE